MPIAYNPTYTDLAYTHYPTVIDSRTVGNAGYNPYLLPNQDYTAGTPLTDNHIVHAEDILAIQDAVMAIERILGTSPQGTSNTVSERISALSTALTIEDLDIRYGGATFSDLTPESEIGGSAPFQPTLIGHHHTGAVNGSSQPIAPSKISLTAEVTGKLPKANLLLDTTNYPATALSGSDIKVTADAGAATIATAISGLVSKSADTTITGNITVSGSLSSTVFIEYDCKNMSQLTATTDSQAWSGTCGQMAAGASNTTNASFKLRYGDYMLSIRAKASSNTNASNILRVRIYGDTTDSAVTYTDYYIKGTDFDASGAYQQFRLFFNHRALTNGNKLILVQFTPVGTSRPTLSFDSLVIAPVGLSGYINN